MPLLKGCQPRLGWVTTVLYFALMKEVMDVRMVVQMSLAGICPMAWAWCMPRVSLGVDSQTLTIPSRP